MCDETASVKRKLFQLFEQTLIRGLTVLSANLIKLLDFFTVCSNLEGNR